MRVTFNGKFSFILTYIFHFITIDWIWKQLEIVTLGKVNGNDADSILLILLCLYITWIAEKGTK